MGMKQKCDPVPLAALADQTTPESSQDSGNAAAAKPLPFEVRELRAQGPNLPVGLVVGGQRSRLFRLRPFKLKQEKALAKLREKAKGGTVGQFVCDALASMVQTLGPHNFDAMKEGERQIAINQLTMADVLYLWVYMRFDALGEEPVAMTIRCRSCTNEYKWFGDLGSMDVRVLHDSTIDTSRTYKLRDGVAFAGAERHVLKLDMMKWDFFSRNFNNKDSQSALAIMGSIVGIEGVDRNPFQMTENDLDEMSKFDIGGITRDIEDNTVGPQMDIEPQCPSCNHKSRMMLDWGYESFFSRSALPTRMTP